MYKCASCGEVKAVEMFTIHGKPEKNNTRVCNECVVEILDSYVVEQFDWCPDCDFEELEYFPGSISKNTSPHYKCPRCNKNFEGCDEEEGGGFEEIEVSSD